MRTLRTVHCYGINTESLGHYLSGLGVLSALSRKWPSVRAAWRSGHMVLLGEGLSLDQVKDYLLSEWQPTPYERWWTDAQKSDTKAKASNNVWRLRNTRPRSDVRTLDAHLVGASRNRFNPVLGTGGNIGKRDLAKLQADARRLIADSAHDSASWLDATLIGDPDVRLPDLPNAGTWFVFANKTFNSGQAWFREGRISPWSAILALEGAFLLVGSINKRLGSSSRAYAVFPFVSQPSQPATDGEIGAAKAEFWAPLWEAPANIVEVRTLFQRGLARIGGRAAQAPHEFAGAARSAGVDAGVSEFVRFELRRTTSSQVYEAVPRQHIYVGGPAIVELDRKQRSGDADLLMQLIESGWLDRIPTEPRDSKQRGKFVGLRGPVEAAIIHVSEQPDEPKRWQSLLQLLATTQFRIDRNRKLRERCIPLQSLSDGWFDRAWPTPIPVEIRIAKAIASIGAGNDYPLVMNVFGVERQRQGRFVFPKSRPQRTVWHEGSPIRLFGDLLHRRLIDMQPRDDVPLDALCPCPASVVHQFLSGGLDEELINRWIPALSLIDWSETWSTPEGTKAEVAPADGRAVLQALFRPFFHPRRVQIGHNEALFSEKRRPHAGLARRLFHLLRYSQIDEAIQVAQDAYLAAGRSIIVSPSGLGVADDRLSASLLIPVRSHDVAAGVRRWIQPRKTQPA